MPVHPLPGMGGPEWEAQKGHIVANKVITFIIDTVEPELDSILAAAINEIHNLGHKVKEIRVADDAGEVKVPANQVEGVTVPEPGSTPAPVEPETPVEAPVETEPEPSVSSPPLGKDEVPTVPLDEVPDPTEVSSTPSDTPA